MSLISNIFRSICKTGMPFSCGTFVTTPFTYLTTASLICFLKSSKSKLMSLCIFMNAL